LIVIFYRRWLADRSDVLVPNPIKLIWYELGNVKRSALQSNFKKSKEVVEILKKCTFSLFLAIPKYADTIVTMILIMTCIVVTVVVLVIVSVQIYAESLYMVQVKDFKMKGLT